MTQTQRAQQRHSKQLRPVVIETGVNHYAEGSVLIKMGNTHVLCTASVLEQVPAFLRDQGQGWVTAEYGMLPRSTHTRSAREAARGKQSGRTQEIQRLIGRSLRAVFDLKKLGERTIQLDCDVLQADGGTRCASITGAWVAAALAVQHLLSTQRITQTPIVDQVAAVSVGMKNNHALLDLDYSEDASCDADINVVLNSALQFVELQGTAEEQCFTRDELNTVLDYAEHGISELFRLQQQAISIR